MKSVKLMDLLLIVLTLFLVLKTCSPSLIPQIPKTLTAKKDPVIVETPAQVENNLETVPEEQEIIPQGMNPDVEGYAPYGTEFFSSATADEEECEQTGGALLDGKCVPFEEGFEQFTQSVTPTPKKCPPSLVYKKKSLPGSDAEVGCWTGDDSVTNSCLPANATKAANFYDAAQTQTVVDAIDRDPTREMKIRQAPATANYDLRASPKVKFNGYPSMSFIKGNSNTGFQTA